MWQALLVRQHHGKPTSSTKNPLRTQAIACFLDRAATPPQITLAPPCAVSALCHARNASREATPPPPLRAAVQTEQHVQPVLRRDIERAAATGQQQHSTHPPHTPQLGAWHTCRSRSRRAGMGTCGRRGEVGPEPHDAQNRLGSRPKSRDRRAHACARRPSAPGLRALARPAPPSPRCWHCSTLSDIVHVHEVH